MKAIVCSLPHDLMASGVVSHLGSKYRNIVRILRLARMEMLPYIPTMFTQRRWWRRHYLNHLRECLAQTFQAWLLWVRHIINLQKRACTFDNYSPPYGTKRWSMYNIYQGFFHGWKRVTRESRLPGALLKQKRAAAVAEFLTRYMVQVSYAKRVASVKEPTPNATQSKRGWEKAMLLFRKMIHVQWNNRPQTLQFIPSAGHDEH